jgi:acetamidase/formamidase
MRIAIGTFVAMIGATWAQAAAPATHRLEVTPSTVAYGYYWAEAAPVLRIASGDIIDVDTLLTNTPMGLAKAGIPDEKIQQSRMTAEFMPGIVIPLHPFFGSLGVAPAPELGRVSSNPPGRHAGNLDNRELVAGSTLFIPVFAPR